MYMLQIPVLRDASGEQPEDVKPPVKIHHRNGHAPRRGDEGRDEVVDEVEAGAEAGERERGEVGGAVVAGYKVVEGGEGEDAAGEGVVGVGVEGGLGGGVGGGGG